MSDYDRERVADEDRLPWLEPVDEEDVPAGGVAAGKLLGALIAALVAIGLIVGGGFWLKQRGTETASNEPTTIPSPADAYKSKPASPGGMQVPGQGDATYSASEGADPDAKIDMNAVAEEPLKAPAPAIPAAPPSTVVLAPPLPATVPVPVRTAAAAPAVQQPKAGTITTAKPATAKPAPVAVAAAKPVPKPAVVKPAPVAIASAKPATPKPAPGTPAKAGGAQVQLGAFSSQAKADAAWKKLSGKFAFLGSARQEVVAAKVGSGTVYRLRASGTGPGACSKLKSAGETCIAVIN